MRELLDELNDSRQRQLVVLRGPRAWCDSGFAALARLPVPGQVLSDRRLGAQPIPFSKADACLGGETRLVVLDLFSGFNPDMLCIAAGLVQAGGVLVLLSPQREDWRASADPYAQWQDGSWSARPRFVDYFFAALEADADIGLLLAPDSIAARRSSLPTLQPCVIERGLTREQAHSLDRIEQWLASRHSGVVLLRAERGRGKSSCLGMLVERIRNDIRVLVCADSRKTATTLLHWAPTVDYIAPDRLLLDNPPADLVIIDEAAMIPGSLLRQIQRLYPRLVMATTTGGYEGTGQGFMLRFVANLDARSLLQLELTEPVRWCRGDALERWLNRVLLIDGAAPAAADAGGETPAPELQLIDDPGDPGCFDILRQVYRLLNAAHYRTRPSDLRMLMENPDLLLVVARCAERVVGAALLNREGGFDADLCAQVFLGQRRPRGHLLAQMLTAQAGIARFAEYRGLRVQRIAVGESWRRRGLGTALLCKALQYARANGLDYVGASFAFDAALAGFWQRAGFSLVHISYARGKSSGNHSIAVLAPMQPPVEADLHQLRRRIERQLPTWMTQFLQTLDPQQVAALLRYAGFTARLSALERAEVEAFARGNKGFELCFVSLQLFVMQCVARSATSPDRLLIEKAVQNRDWRRLETDSGAEGRRQLQKRLRGLVEAELKACYHDSQNEDHMPREIIDFWFTEAVRKRWFKSTPAFDEEVRERFLETWERASRGELDHWQESAEGSVALVIVLDQFPLNMFRGEARSFSTEAQSREVARNAIERGFDQLLEVEQRAFLYMPFMHSENLADQRLALKLFDQEGLENNYRFAVHHHGIIEKFGRFPHRNEILGRASSAAEIEYLNSGEAFTG